MVNALSIQMTVVLALLITASASAQTCDVYTRAELDVALAAGCDHIRIPLGTTITVNNDDVRIDAAHNGLHLEIVGTVLYNGTAGGGQVFNLVGCSNVLIDGGGTLTSIHDGNTVSNIARAIRVDATTNVTNRNLNFDNLTSAVEGEQDTSTNLVIDGIHGTNMSRYLIYTTHTRSTVTVHDCHVNGAGFHGVRLYGDNITVTDCSMYGEDGRGLWIVHENFDTSWADAARISSQRMIMLGPDFGTGSGDGARRHNLFAHDLKSLDHVRIEMGVIGGCIIDVCSNLTVGREGDEIENEFDRPMDRVNWDAIHDPTPSPPPNEHVTVVSTPYMTNSAAVTYNWCFADINREGASDRNVDVSDLLAVISAWGACPPAPSNTPGPPPHCAADIAPTICGDDVVNVSDLLAVISSCGACPANPQCGDEPPTSAGMPEAFPRTMSECWTACEEKFAVESQEWIACYEACIEAIERLEDEGP